MNGSLEKSIEYVKEITKLNDNIIGSNKLEITNKKLEKMCLVYVSR